MSVGEEDGGLGTETAGRGAGYDDLGGRVRWVEQGKGKGRGSYWFYLVPEQRILR